MGGALALMTLLAGAQTLEDRIGTGHSATALEARICAAVAVYAEARGESYLGRALVAQTIVNRVRRSRYPAHSCAIVLDAYQAVHALDAPPWVADLPAWQDALDVVDAVIEADYVPAPPACASATHFHTLDSQPWWAIHPSMREVCRVGNHVFLTEGEPPQ